MQRGSKQPPYIFEQREVLLNNFDYYVDAQNFKHQNMQ